VLSFRSSDALGNAYGLAVIGTMTITSIVFFIVMRRVWQWTLIAAVPVLVGFLTFDLAFLGANLAKLLQGAWVPLAIGVVVFLLLWAWTRGRARYGRALESWAMKVEDFQRDIAGWQRREAGTVVFLTFDLGHVPLVGRHAWLRANCRYDRVLLLRIEPSRTARVAEEHRVEVTDQGGGLVTAIARFGFMESPAVGDVLPRALALEWDETVFVLAQPITAGKCSFLGRIVLAVYQFLRQTGVPATERFRIPPGRSITVGLELKI
jgi:KUP system potassium uptake protein